MVPTTVGRQAQPQEASPARCGRSRNPINMTSPTMETTTTAGTLMALPVECGATLQTLPQSMRSAQCLSVLKGLPMCLTSPWM